MITLRNKLLSIGIISLLMHCSGSQAGDMNLFRPKNVALIATGLVSLGTLAWYWYKGDSSADQPTTPPQVDNPDKPVDNPTDVNPADVNLMPDAKVIPGSPKQKTKKIKTTSKKPSVEPDPIDELLDELNEELLVGKSPCRGRFMNLPGTVSLAQVKVLSQFSKRGGGDASCGYQALKNSILALFSLIAGTDDLNGELHDPKIIKELFGADGTWRNHVITERVKVLFKDFIVSHLQAHLRPAADVNVAAGFNRANIRGKYLDLLGEYSKGVLCEILRGQKVGIDFAGFLNFLSHAEIQIADQSPYYHSISPDPVDLRALMRTPEFVELFFNGKALKPFELVLNPSSIQQVKKDYLQRNPGGHVSLDGEWADETEIQQLLKVDPKTMGAKMYTVIGDTSMISPDYDFMPEWQKLQAIRTELMSSSVANYIHCFILGTMGRRIEEGQSAERTAQGHWYSLIAHKTGGRRYYYIADSANHCRLYTDQIKSIIGALEGQDSASLLIPSTAETARLEKALKLMVGQKDCPQDKRHRILDINNLYRERGGTYEGLGGHDKFIAEMQGFLG